MKKYRANLTPNQLSAIAFEYYSNCGFEVAFIEGEERNIYYIDGDVIGNLTELNAYFEELALGL